MLDELHRMLDELALSHIRGFLEPPLNAMLDDLVLCHICEFLETPNRVRFAWTWFGNAFSERRLFERHWGWYIAPDYDPYEWVDHVELWLWSDVYPLRPLRALR